MLSFTILGILAFCVNAKIPCDPSSFRFINPHLNVKHNRPYLFKIANFKEIGCAINVLYKWEVLEPYNGELRKIEQKVLYLDKITEKTENILDLTKLSKKRDIFGKAFAVRVILIPSHGFLRSYRIHYFEVEQEEYKLTIIGGKRRIHHLGRGALWINVTVTRETNRESDVNSFVFSCEPPLKAPPAESLSWKILEQFLHPNEKINCSVNVSLSNSGRRLASYQVIEILSMKTHPVLDIICKVNCENSQAADDVVLQYICYKDCYGSPEWSMIPYSSETQRRLIVSENNNSVIIPGTTFDQGTYFKMTLTLGEVVVSYAITFPPLRQSIGLKCMLNCYYRQKDIHFQVFCFDFCKDLRYQWELKPYINKFNWSYYLEFIPNNDKLIIPAHTLPLNNELTLSVKTKYTTSELKFTPMHIMPNITLECAVCKVGKDVDIVIPVAITVKCSSDCHAIEFYIWSLKPPLPEFHWYDYAIDENKTLIIPAFSYKSNTQVIATVYLESSGQPRHYTFVYSGGVQVKLLCIKHCTKHNEKNIIEYQNTVTIGIFCSQKKVFQDCDPNADYKWSVTPTSEIYRANSKSKIEERNHGRILIIPAYYHHPPEQQAVVSVKVNHISAQMRLFYKVDTPELSIICFQNCLELAEVGIDVVLKAICLKNCQDIKYVWDLQPRKELFLWHDHIDLYNQNETLIIKADTFEHSDVVEVSLMSLPIHSLATYTLFFKNSTPEIELVCSDNCFSLTYVPVNLLANCTKFCPIRDQFQWDIFPKPSNFSWILEDKNQTLIIPAFSFLHDQRVRVEVSLLNAMASLTLQFHHDEPNYSLSCEPLPCEKYQNRREKVRIIVRCRWLCSRSYRIKWIINPLPDTFNWDTDTIPTIYNDVITILPSTFNHLDEVTVSAMIGQSYLANTTIRFKEPKPGLSVICLQNCNHSNPHKEVHLKVICNYMCKYIKEYKWEIDPPSLNFKYDIKMSPKWENIEIRKDAYKDGDIVNATVIWNTYTATYKIAFVEPPPSLKIVCMINCQYYFDKKTSFKVVCNDICSENSDFNWEFQPKAQGTLKFSKSKKFVTIPPFLYNIGNVLNISVCTGKECARHLAKFSYSPYYFHIVCINCFSAKLANPLVETKFKVVCVKECEEILKFNWQVTPRPIHFLQKQQYYLDSTTRSFTLHSNVFSNVSCINVAATTGNATKNIDVCFLAPSPKIRILCEQNCGYPSPNAQTIFNATCFEHCYKPVFRWIITPMPFKSIHSRLLNMAGSKIIIPPRFFKDKQRVEIKAVVGTGTLFEIKEILFAEPLPIIKVICKHNCSKVHPREDVLLQVICLQNCNNLFFIWTISPIPRGFLWSLNITTNDDNSSLIINKGTYGNGSKVSVQVETRSQVFVQTQLHYFLPSPSLSLDCEENCHFNPSIVTIYNILCIGECSTLKKSIHCFLEPMPRIPEDFSFNENLIRVEASAYGPGVLVVAKCKAFQVETKINMNFEYPPWDGSCDIFPESGISGETRYTVECRHFTEKANYRVYQYIPRFDVSLKLHSSIYPYMPDLNLAPSEKAMVKVDVSEGWQVRKQIFLTVENYPFYKNIRHTRTIEWQEIHNIQIRDKFFMFEELVMGGKIAQAFQMAFVLQEHLQYAPDNVRLYYLRRILFLYQDMVNYFEPLPAIVLLQMSLMGNRSTPYILHISIEMVLALVKRLYFWNETSITYNISLRKYDATILLSTTVITLEQGVEYTENEAQKSYQSSSSLNNISPKINETNEIRLSVEHESALRHFREVTLCAIRIAELTTEFIKTGSKVATLESKKINVAVVELSTKYIVPFKLSFEMSGSFAIFVPSDFKNSVPLDTKELIITFKLILFEVNPFWWDSSEVKFQSNIISFSAVTKDLQKVSGASQQNIKLLKPKQYQQVHTRLNKNDHKVWLIYSPPDYTIEVLIEANQVIVSTSSVKPDRSYTKKNGVKVIGMKYICVGVVPVYLSVIGTGDVTFKYTAVQCSSWHGDSWSWNNFDCKVINNEHDDSLVICDCTSFSLFIARSSVPKGKQVFDKDFLLYPKKGIWRYRILIISLLVFLLLFALIIYSMIKDRMLARKKKYTVLSDINNSKEIYVIAVQTGFWPQSGTTARVVLEIQSWNGENYVQALNIADKNVLQRNSLDFFVISTETVLGQIRNIKIWHDSYGKKPDWFCDFIIVRHFRSNQSQIFVISRWFSISKKPFSTNGQFKPVPINVPIQFTTKLKESLRENFGIFTLPFFRATNSTYTMNAVVNGVSILVIMTLAIYLVNSNENVLNIILDVFLCVLIGSIIHIVLELIFQRINLKQ